MFEDSAFSFHPVPPNCKTVFLPIFRLSSIVSPFVPTPLSVTVKSSSTETNSGSLEWRSHFLPSGQSPGSGLVGNLVSEMEPVIRVSFMTVREKMPPW